MLNRTFRHAPLERANRQIRLFTFQTTSTGSVVKISLSTWPFEVLRRRDHDPKLLKSCPRYTAISYHWGDATLCRIIEANQRIFPVTQNARYALQQVQHHFAIKALNTIYFWMDSLCVDQDNLDEKAEQVQLMGDIFEHAVDVLACVGPHEDQSELVFDVLREADFASTYYQRRPVEERRSFNYLEHRRIRWKFDTSFARARFNDVLKVVLDRHHRTSPEFDVAVEQFASREYWYRIWIVQEIRLAKYVKILCGFDSLDLEHIGPFCSMSELMKGEEAAAMPASLRRLEQSKMGLILLDSLVHSGFRQA